LTVVAEVRCIAAIGTRDTSFRTTENNGEGVTGNGNLIVHTDPAFNPTAQ
jgi:hypothetical protein